MAAPIARCVFRNIYQRPFPACILPLRAKSTSSTGVPDIADRKPQVALSPDGSTLLCWHPETEFPYEHTRPIPRKVQELEEAETVLKVQYLMSEKLKLREDGPNDKELAAMFYTSKHQWNPQPQKKYKKVRTIKERERL